MTKQNNSQNITNTAEKELFDIVTNLSRRLKIMPEDNSILLTYFNSSLKEWISENIGDIKKENDSALEVSTLSKILIKIPVANEELNLTIITFVTENERGNLELHMICKDMEYKKYNQGLLFNKNKLVKHSNIDNFDSELVSYIYVILFEVKEGMDIAIRDKIENDIRQIVTEYMDLCIKSGN